MASPSMLVVRFVTMQRGVAMEDALLVETLVEAVVGGFERGPDLLEAAFLGARGECIDVGQGAFDLLQDSQRVRLNEDRPLIDKHLNGAGVGGDVALAATITAAHAQGDPG